MDQDFKKRWVEALRSGKYKQGEGRLRTEEDCYCCLGVGCDVLGKGEWVRHKYAEKDELWAYKSDILETAVMPSDLKDAVGLTAADSASLIRLNDFEKRTFAEIADYIEDNL